MTLFRRPAEHRGEFRRARRDGCGAGSFQLAEKHIESRGGIYGGGGKVHDQNPAGDNVLFQLLRLLSQKLLLHQPSNIEPFHQYKNM